MKIYKLSILFIFTITLNTFSQSKSNVSLMMCKLTTKNIFYQKYKPYYKYFRNYENKIGFSLKYNFTYFKRLELSPNIEIYFLNNKVTNLNGIKYDFNLYNGYNIYQYKKWDINLNTGLGYSFFKISNSKQSNYFFSHMYKGYLINIDIETRFKLNNNFLLNICLTNSFNYILKKDEYIRDEDISYKNDFMILKFGLNYIFKSKQKNNREGKK